MNQLLETPTCGEKWWRCVDVEGIANSVSEASKSAGGAVAVMTAAAVVSCSVRAITDGSMVGVAKAKAAFVAAVAVAVVAMAGVGLFVATRRVKKMKLQPQKAYVWLTHKQVYLAANEGK